MGSIPRPPSLVDQWVADGGIVVTASDRAARAAQMAFHRRRRAEGASAWPAPSIQSWTDFVSSAWEQFARDERLILNPAQELELWSGIIGREGHLVTALEAPRLRIARLAMDAHALLCSHAQRLLEKVQRSTWDRDAAAFSRWLSTFDEACARGSFVPPARLALDLIPNLQHESAPRPQILLLGFDRLLPIHKSLFDAWGTQQQPEPGLKSSDLHFFAARDEESELAACATWCMNQLALNHDARLLVLTQDIADRRGEIERAFLHSAPAGSPPFFEFSLGVPLVQVPLARAASLFLRWLDGPLSETELDWIFFSGYLTASPDEALELQAHMRSLRRCNLARPDWPLNVFLASGRIPSAWLRRITRAQHLLSEARSLIRTPLEWSALVPDLLRAIGLPSEHALSSAEFQVWQRWEYALDLSASLGFDGRRIAWSDFLPSLERILETTLFAPESADAPIQIVGPGESAGLTAGGIWFLGAYEDAWPAAGSAHPFLPLSVQREFDMPHASPRHDAELSALITRRLANSAPVVNFSYPISREEAEARPSRIVVQQAGAPNPIPAKLIARPRLDPLATVFEDAARVPFLPGKAPGGSSVLTAQSQCPFKAFAIARLGAESWEPAEFGLTAPQRGLLLHEVMHAVWGGPPHGLHTLSDLLACGDLEDFVSTHVDRALAKLPDETRRRMPKQYLTLEAKRLTRVVTEWLGYEAGRHPFEVVETESQCTVNIGGLAFELRLDRIDKLNNGSFLVIDYKTGNVNPRDWDLPRPDDVQLPLYAGFACDAQPGGLVFAKLRTGDFEFAGRVENAPTTLLSDLGRTTSLVKKPLTSKQLDDWRSYIEQLALDFLTGRADVDPRDYPKTCEKCGLHAICRIHENWIKPEPEEEEELPPYD